MLDHCHEFRRAAATKPLPLWPSVRRELRLAKAILPLLGANLGLSWDPLLTTSDACLIGYRVCESMLDDSLAGSLGRTCERWRYDDDDAVAARSRALGSEPSDMPKASAQQSKFLAMHSELFKTCDFGQIVFSGRFDRPETFMKLEDVVLEKAVRRCFKRIRWVNTRLLFLLGNVSLCLALAKRGSSNHA
jgi:hypothetical protein